jgi:hypothetical protein
MDKDEETVFRLKTFIIEIRNFGNKNFPAPFEIKQKDARQMLNPASFCFCPVKS